MMGNTQKTRKPKESKIVSEVKPVEEQEEEVEQEVEEPEVEQEVEEPEVEQEVEEPEVEQEEKEPEEKEQENPLLMVDVKDKSTSFQLLIAFINLAFSRGAYTREEVEKIIECINMFTV